MGEKNTIYRAKAEEREEDEENAKNRMSFIALRVNEEHHS